MMERGLVHIYSGEGKGKTTAAVGLAVRFAGAGGRVLFTQFLKKDTSGELVVLRQVEPIKLLLCEKSFGFTFQMGEEQKREAAKYYTAHLTRVLAEARHMAYRSSQEAKQSGGLQPGVLLVLDEILAAYNQGMVNRQELLDFLKERPEGLEIALTGRDPAPEVSCLADYETVMGMGKHPYRQGIAARRGIEW